MISRRHRLAAVFAGCALLLAALDGAQPGRKGRGGDRPAGVFHTEVPAHVGSIVLARPTDNSITVSVLVSRAADGLLAWGTDERTLGAGRRAVSLQAGVPQAVVLDGLAPDTRYFYELRNATDGRRLLPESGVGTFQTARPPGRPFTFTIIADSHLDENTDPAVYRRALELARAAAPDFHVDLGDTFMTDKHPSRESAARQYLAQRFYLGQLCHSAPLFFVLGNHDGENPRDRRDDDLTVWSVQMRKRYFPNPVPGGFYSGNDAPHPAAGPLEDYFAWEWGDALFVVLDPYWFTRGDRSRGDNWLRTLGERQYQWLGRTLEASRAKFKFVFIHHLVGGRDSQGRGGVDAAALYEWGGRNADGSDGFARNRPGWPMPVHQLLVRHAVTAVFHGHDHLYAKQDLDGIVYQELPQPGNPRANARNATDYGYRTGTILGGAGFLRVMVAPEQATVDYIRSDRPASGPAVGPPLVVEHSYAIPPRR